MTKVVALLWQLGIGKSEGALPLHLYSFVVPTIQLPRGSQCPRKNLHGVRESQYLSISKIFLYL